MLNGAPRKTQAGFSMVESLVAILVFFVGILGFMGFRAVSVQNVSETKLRAEAALLANDLVAQMLSTDVPAGAFASPPGDLYSMPPILSAWSSKVSTLLPGARDRAPVIEVAPESTTSAVTITMFWRMPGATEYSRHVVQTRREGTP